MVLHIHQWVQRYTSVSQTMSQFAAQIGTLQSDPLQPSSHTAIITTMLKASEISQPHVPGTVHEPVVALQPGEQMATSQFPVAAPFWFCQPLRHRQSPAVTQNPLTQPECVEQMLQVGPDHPFEQAHCNSHQPSTCACIQSHHIQCRETCTGRWRRQDCTLGCCTGPASQTSIP